MVWQATCIMVLNIYWATILANIIDISHNLTKLLRKLQTVLFPDTTWMSQEMSFFEIKSINPSLTHTHTHPFNGPLSGLPGWAGTRKVKPIWILLKQETVSGSSISWAICKSAPRFRQITMPAPRHSVFYRPDALPAAQPTASKHWRHITNAAHIISRAAYM